jgi:hypothetical protein
LGTLHWMDGWIDDEGGRGHWLNRLSVRRLAVQRFMKKRNIGRNLCFPNFP